MNVYKSSLLLLTLSLFIFNSAFPQGGTWTWVGGTDSTNAIGVYGTQGVPSVNNHPPGNYEVVEWKDKQGNFWIYGGTYPDMSDLWKYNPVTNEWTWVKGDGGTDEPPVYGTKGMANSSNTPGSRSFCAATWVDTSGNFWLFGGVAIDVQNDLWKYDVNTNLWTWINGDSIYDAKGVHGVQGVPSPSNVPGARNETCSAWTDSLNNLWLFGGYGYDDDGYEAALNDLCKYDINTNEWTWMKGSQFLNASPNYGIIGVADTNNDPGARWSYTKWKDKQGNFWLMGGLDVNINCLNDVWKYDLNVNQWIWMNGPNVENDGGNYQSNCLFDTISLPQARLEQRSSVTDNCGRFWLFGGIVQFIPPYSNNDLMVFDSQNLKWNWISGWNRPSNYGTLGVASYSNIPPPRGGAVAWWGNDNKFYMFGGLSTIGIYSDVWVFSPDTNCVPVCNTMTIPL